MAQVRLLSASHTVGVCDSGTRTTAASSLNLRLAGLKDVEWFGEPSTCPATVDEFSDGNYTNVQTVWGTTAPRTQYFPARTRAAQ
jgi:hypothetical protein